MEAARKTATKLSSTTKSWLWPWPRHTETLKLHLPVALRSRRPSAVTGQEYMAVLREQVFKKTILQLQTEQMANPSAL